MTVDVVAPASMRTRLSAEMSASRRLPSPTASRALPPVEFAGSPVRPLLDPPLALRPSRRSAPRRTLDADA